VRACVRLDGLIAPKFVGRRGARAGRPEPMTLEVRAAMYFRRARPRSAKSLSASGSWAGSPCRGRGGHSVLPSLGTPLPGSTFRERLSLRRAGGSRPPGPRGFAPGMHAPSWPVSHGATFRPHRRNFQHRTRAWSRSTSAPPRLGLWILSALPVRRGWRGVWGRFEGAGENNGNARSHPRFSPSSRKARQRLSGTQGGCPQPVPQPGIDAPPGSRLCAAAPLRPR